MEEIWKVIPTFEDRYEVSSCGHVRNMKSGHILKSDPSSGQKVVSLVTHGVITVYEIRYLMVCAFFGVDIRDPVKPRILHKDGNLFNIQLSNLEVGSVEEHDGETWADIPGYAGIYQVSTCGRVKRVAYEEAYVRSDTGATCIRRHRERILNPTTTSGYFEVNLVHSGQSKYCRIHRLVAELFVPNPQNLPQVNHIDGNKLNNCLSNLEWCTAQYNIDHATRVGIRHAPQRGVYRKPVSVRCNETGQTYPNMRAASQALGLNYYYLSERVRQGLPCCGYTFTKL